MSLVVVLYFVVKDIEFCVIYILLNLFNFNLIGFRYHKSKKKRWGKIPFGDQIPAGDGDGDYPRPAPLPSLVRILVVNIVEI